MQFKNENHDYPALFSGIDIDVPILNGQNKRYVNFDNAASTPTFEYIYDRVGEYLQYYSNVHRGTGFKSLLSSEYSYQGRDKTQSM